MACALAERNELGMFQPGNRFSVGIRNGRKQEWTEQEIAQEVVAIYDWMDNPKNYFFTTFLTQRGLCPEHLDRFASRSSDFREALKMAKLIQEERLVELAVSKKGDGSFIKFILSNKNGWKEKTEISGDSANPLALVLEQIAKQNQDPIEIQALESEQLTNQSVESTQSIEPQQHS